MFRFIRGYDDLGLPTGVKTELDLAVDCDIDRRSESPATISINLSLITFIGLISSSGTPVLERYQNKCKALRGNCTRSRVHSDGLVAYFLAVLKCFDVSLLCNLPCGHNCLILSHTIEIAGKAKLLRRLASNMNKFVIKILQLCASGCKMTGDALTERMECLDIAFHVTEVLLCTSLIELRRGMGSNGQRR